MRRASPFLLLAAAVSAVGCSSAPSQSTLAVATRHVRNAADPQRVARSVVAAMDPEADPCENFYRYACGGWVRETARQPDRLSNSRGLGEIADYNRVWLWERLATADPGASDSRRALTAFYQTCMDESAIDASSATTLRRLLEAVSGADDLDSIMRLLARLHAAGIPALFTVEIHRDWENPEAMIALLSPVSPYGARLETALANDPRHRERLMRRYAKHVSHTLDSMGVKEGDGDHVMAFEEQLAAGLPAGNLLMMHRIDATRLGRAAFDKLVAPLPFGEYFAAAGLGTPSVIAVRSDEYMQAMAAAVSGSLSTTRAYLSWHVVRALAPYLPAEVRDAQRLFQQFGVAEGPSRWNFCVATAENELSDVVAQLYADEGVGGAGDATLRELLTTVQGAATTRIGAAQWLEPTARDRAAGKLAAVNVVVGDPQAEAAPIPAPDAAFLDAILAARAERVARLNARVVAPPGSHPAIWTTVSANAFYTPSYNQVRIARGLLRPPIYDPALPRAMNYGALGFVLGHELGHALDDEGRRYDARGHLVAWDSQAAAAFEERDTCLKTHYARYRTPSAQFFGQTIAGEALDPDRTANENYADVVGLQFAYDAFLLNDQSAAAASVVPGLSNRELFFVSFAQAWCTLPDSLVAHVVARTDAHAPAGVRANAALRQMPEFARAFGCGAPTRMRLADPCEMW